MGTRSLTVFKNEQDQEIVVMYRQFDGYIDGHGRALANFLKDIKIVNGYSPGAEEKQANGMSCLAAQVVAHFKDGVGDFYLYPAGSRDRGEEYTYTVEGNPGSDIVITVDDIFKGTPQELLLFSETPA